MFSDLETGVYEMEKLFEDNSHMAFYVNFGLDIETYGPYVACEIIDLPGKYNGRNTAFGFQKGSPYRNLFSYFLKYMEEKGVSQEIIGTT